MHDVMDNLPEKTIKCLDKGFVTLVDVMPRLVPEDQKTADFAIVQAARVSYGNGTKTVNEDRGLIRYLFRHAHTTPVEMVEFKFHMKMPIFCARQAVRHRTANINEISGRYSVLKDDFYFPEEKNVRQQSKTNKQGGDQQVDVVTAQEFMAHLDMLCNESYKQYEKYIADGISREQARMMLPINIYTEWYWKCDAHNLLHFLALRCDPHAQWEIRTFGEAILSLIQPIVPITIEAWNDYHHSRGAVKFSRLEMEALKEMLQSASPVAINTDNKREQQEWLEKTKKLGIAE